jgi:uncharacterized protein YwqG
MPSLDPTRRDRLIAVARRYGYEPAVPLLEPLALPCIQFVPSERDDGRRIGGTRVGGVPDLPPHLSWQRAKSGKYMVFVAQINLSDLTEGDLAIPNSPLPSSGRLYFFHGETGRAYAIDHRVLYDDSDPAALRPAALPPLDEFDEEEEDYTHYAGWRVLMRPSISLASDSGWEERLPDDFVEPPPYAGVPYPHLELERELRAHDEQPRESCQVWGHPSAYTAKPARDAQQVREGFDVFDGSHTPDRTEVAKWRLLLEIGSLSPLKMLWWDAGMLQFMIHTDDLAARSFSRTYCCIETS